MESIVKFLEKGQPYFDKVSKNIYLQAIKDGFLAAMPIILSSSVFLLISTLPGVVATVGGFTLPDWWNVDVVTSATRFTTSRWASWASWSPAPPQAR